MKNMAIQSNISRRIIVFCLGFLFVRFPVSKGQFTTEVHGVIGKSVMIPCDIILSDDVSIVTWQRPEENNDIYIFDSRKTPLVKGKHHITIEYGNRINFLPLAAPPSLLMKKLKLEDEGLYKCFVDFKRQRSKIFTTFLRVIIPPKEMKIMDSLGNEIEDTLGPFLENMTTELECQVIGGRPSPIITWWLGPSLLDRKIDRRGPNSRSNVLKIGPLTRRDHGKRFQCQAMNSNTTSPLNKNIILEMNYPPSGVEITTTQSPLVAMAEYQITCKSQGARPPAVISWQLDGEVLVNTRNHTIHTGDNTINTLSFTPKEMDGGKTLLCVAKSPLIQHDPLLAQWKLDIYYIPNVQLSLLTKNPKEGDTVTLKCATVSNPPTTNITWFHKGKKLNVGKDETIEMSADILTLKNVTRKTSGIFSCLASNEVGTGKSKGQVLHVRYIPICSTPDIQIVGVSLHETVSIACVLNASSSVDKFRWQFANAEELIDFPENRFTLDEKSSVLTYTSRSNIDFGIMKCWGKNELGEQREPCIFEIVEASFPEKPKNCTFMGTTSYIFVQCAEGNDGGLNQTFIAEIFDMSTNSKLMNISNHEAVFAIDDLPGGTDFLLIIYSINNKGSSEKEHLQVYTSAPVVKAIDFINIFPITPILGILIGVVGALVIGSIIIFLVMRLKSKPTKKDHVDDETGKPHKDGDEPRDDSGVNGEGSRGMGPDGRAIPDKLKHANLYEAAAYEKPEGHNQTKNIVDDSFGKDADLEYAELEFQNSKKKNKKSKNSKKKNSKNPSKTNGKIHGAYDPTLYASIDHVQTEKQRIAANEPEKTPCDSHTKDTPKGGEGSLLAPPSPIPAPPSPRDLFLKEKDPYQAPQPYNQPTKRKDYPVNAQEPQTPLDMSTPKKSTGKPTNLDKPSTTDQPLGSFSSFGKDKKSSETQTSPPSGQRPFAPDAVFGTKALEEEIPLMDETIESSL